MKFSTYFVPSKLTAQDGMDVNLKSFEKITIDGNVSATLRGSINAHTLIGDDGADTIEGRAGADTLLEEIDKILYLVAVIQELPKRLPTQLQTLFQETILLI